jgi:hypothetical protein
MDDLLLQVPELNLRKSVGTRTIHRNDLPNFPNNRQGDTIKLVSYYDQNGVRWTEADIKYFLFLKDAVTRTKQTEPELELEAV